MARVLIVEDDPHLRHVIGRLLVEAGYQVAEAATGTDPLEAWRGTGADVVLTDIRPPDFSGVGIILQFRAQAPEVPVVAMTSGNPWDIQMLQEAELGAAAVLQKPFDGNQLTAAIAAVLAGLRERQG
jgi:DNA-binding response OmpR family regulator